MKKILFLFVSFLSIMGCNDTHAQTSAKKLNVAAFEKLITTDKTVQLVDVRTPQEVAKGMIANAKNINFNDAAFKEKMNQLDKSKPIAVYCGVGGRSGKASTILTELGFKIIYDLEGGMTAWNAAGKTIVK